MKGEFESIEALPISQDHACVRTHQGYMRCSGYVVFLVLYSKENRRNKKINVEI